MALSAEFDSAADKVAYAIVASGAAALSYDHARSFFLPFMGGVGASVTPLLLDAVVYWLATACIRQARMGRPLPMLRLGAYALLSLSVMANALGGATLWERVFMALPAALFGFLTEVQIRLAMYVMRQRNGGDDRLALALWLAHPLGTLRALVWKAGHAAPAFAAATAERDRLRAARGAVRLAMPGRSKAVRRARKGVLRELSAGRLSPADAVAASGLLERDDVHRLHRAALIAALGGTSRVRTPAATGRTPGAPANRTPGATVSRTRTRTPGAPTTRTRSPHSGAVTDEAAEMHFAAELADGQVPSQRRIKAELHVGQYRAAQIHARLTALAAADATPSPDAADVLAEDLTADITPADNERTVAS